MTVDVFQTGILWLNQPSVFVTLAYFDKTNDFIPDPWGKIKGDKLQVSLKYFP